MKLYLALLPFTAWVEGIRMEFAYCGFYALPPEDQIIKELVRLNALREMEFDGQFKPGKVKP